MNEELYEKIVETVSGVLLWKNRENGNYVLTNHNKERRLHLTRGSLIKIFKSINDQNGGKR